MAMYNQQHKTAAMIIAGAFLLSGCGDEEVFQNSGNVTANPGTVSQNNFSVLASDLNPSVFDSTGSTLTFTTLTITAYVGDINNQVLTDPHTVYFKAEWGLIEPSCTTVAGTCSVTWQSSQFGTQPTDFQNTITAYTAGVESFTDTNGNGSYDDADAGFDDIEEPYVDVDESNSFTAGDLIIDTVNGNDTTGSNGVHDIGDGLYNGSACTHTSQCSTLTLITVWDDVTIDMQESATP